MTEQEAAATGASPSTDGAEPGDEVRRDSLYADVSREMVRIYKEQFGRGPTKVRTAHAGQDCLICTLENSMTPAEQNMVKMGEHQRLRDIRMFFQHASEAEFCEAVERLTGRKVRGFVSGIDTRKDISSEIFYLEPDGDAVENLA